MTYDELYDSLESDSLFLTYDSNNLLSAYWRGYNDMRLTPAPNNFQLLKHIVDQPNVYELTTMIL